MLLPADKEEAEKVTALESCYTDMVNGVLTEPLAFAGKRAGDCRQEIIEHCKQNLAGFKKPGKVVFGPLPKTATGKIQKYELRKRFGG